MSASGPGVSVAWGVLTEEVAHEPWKWVAPVTEAEGTVSRAAVLIRECVAAAGVDGGGLSMVSGPGEREPVYASDEVATTIESLQFTLGEGPGVDASDYGIPVLVPDIDDADDSVLQRWPVFVEQLAELGVRAIFAFPVRLGAIWLGAMDLYRTRTGPLEGRHLAAALRCMDALGLAVLENTHTADRGTSVLSLVVHRAAGMVMVQLGSTIEDALLRLRAAAFAEGRAIEALAADVVHGRRRFAKEER